jgi:hypothetical protein
MTPAAYATTISFGASLPDVDLTKYAKFSPFSGPLLAKDDARFFAPRIAFTGGIPAKRYVYYRITSSIRFNPFLPDDPEQVGMGGGMKDKLLQTENAIIDALKRNQREIYGTEYEEYKLQF